MQFPDDFVSHLKKVVPELGVANDIYVVSSDDDSTTVAVEYLVPSERWRSFVKRWQARRPEDSAVPC